MSPTTIEIDALSPEVAVPFEFTLRRTDVEALAEPIVSRTLRICAGVLSQAGLDPGRVEKAILVGQHALDPWVRERLARPRDGLGMPLEFTVDPASVVVRRAAIFVATQPLLPLTGRPAKAGQAWPARPDASGSGNRAAAATAARLVREGDAR